MRDYEYAENDDQFVKIADLETSTILRILQEGEVNCEEDNNIPWEDFVERLRIELVARQISSTC